MRKASLLLAIPLLASIVGVVCCRSIQSRYADAGLTLRAGTSPSLSAASLERSGNHAGSGSAMHSAMAGTHVYKSVNGRQIEVLEFGSGPETAMVIGGTHGDELGGIVLARELNRRLSKLSPSAFSRRIILVPIVNPDGFAMHKRTNAHGVDLNRNMPSKDFNGKLSRSSSRYGGKTPGSEPETKAIMDIVKRFRPELIISLHTPLGRVIYSGPSREEAQIISKLTGFPAMHDIGYPMPGSMDSLFGTEQGYKWIMVEVLHGAKQWGRCGRSLFAVLGVSGSDAEAQLPPMKSGRDSWQVSGDAHD